MTTWTVTEREKDYAVSWKRKIKVFPSEREALIFVNTHRAQGDRIVKVEQDGYRSSVTRRSWRGR